MQTWVKYSIAFFALILVLTGFIYAFGPASTRRAFQSGELATGQLRADHQTAPQTSSTLAPTTTESGTTRAPIDGRRKTMPAGLPTDTNGAASPYSGGDESGNPEALPAH